MKLYLDSEFTGLHQHSTLISLGLITETGKTFYAEFNDYDKSQVTPWIKNNVIKNLKFNNYKTKITHPSKKDTNIKDSTEVIRSELLKWLESFYTQFEIWSDLLPYDWVLFCELFGGALNIPSCIYYIPFDLCTLFEINNIDPDINREEFAGVTLTKRKHNALFDAYVIRLCVEKILKNK
jgi:hypothetical protein